MHEKSQMAFFAALLDSTCLIFKFYIVLRSTKKLEKLRKLENFRAVRMEKSRPLERVKLANQIIVLTTEMLAKKSEIFINVSLPNFMAFH